MILRVDEVQLQEILRLGLGRAILYAQSHDISGFRDVILDACLHCYAYDIQCEGTRASYMYDLVGCLPNKDFYYDRALESLKETGDDWDAAQRFHFAACLAFDGNEDAKRAMYAHYNPGPRYGELIGVDFLELDGIEGFLFVAEKIGALLQEKADEVDQGYLLSRSLDICGEQSTWDALRKAGATNPSIDRYKQAAEETSRRPTGGQTQRSDIASLTYEQLFSEWPGNKPYLLWKWGEQAGDQELQLAARGLIAAKDSKHQLAHLRIFARRRFPLDVRALLALVDVEEDRVAFAAMKALTHLVHPAVRTLAFRLIEARAMCRGEAIDLLVQNYEPGDHRIVLRWFQEEKDPETLHSLGMGLIHFWKQHPDEETELVMMRSLYERGPCSVCREKAVKRLLERSALSDELRAECAWDANSDIRDLVNPTVAPPP
jgi:hypothetical protein